jgi:hypothetical protein
MNQKDALWFARRQDAEAVAADDEDAWHVLLFIYEYIDIDGEEPKR